jgi:2-keto-4-pentenoate hydratase/2-oxohepta-3-ene-1,7-dioic acid hydratase in catechol pathway
MKFLSYSFQGRASWGLATDTGVVSLSSASYPTLRSALVAGVLEKLGAAAQGQADTCTLMQITYLPVITDPGKIICIGHNYEEHRIETERDKTENPTVFLRVAESQTGHLQPLLMPQESDHFDYEGEIAVVIGQSGRRIPRSRAWEHVAGYSAYNDGSVRDWQRHTTQFTPGKNFVGTGAFGPVLVTRGDIADGEELTLTTRLNGQVMQQATTAMMIFPIPRLIEYVSTFTSLAPGDVIVSGTPGGVGARRQPPVWMKEGDLLEVEVSKIGVLRNRVEKEKIKVAFQAPTGLDEWFLTSETGDNHEKTIFHKEFVGCDCRDGRGCAGRGLGSGLARPTDQVDLVATRRGGARYFGAFHCGESEQAIGPAHRGGKPSRRTKRHRCPSRYALTRRWICLLLCDHGRDGDQHLHLQGLAVRPGKRLCTGALDRSQPFRDRCRPRFYRQHPGRCHRPGQSPARKIGHRFRGA